MKLSRTLLFNFMFILMMAGCMPAEDPGTTGEDTGKPAEEQTHQEDTNKETDSDPKSEQDQESEQKENKPSQATIKAVGDILIHERVYRDAQTTEGYDFSPMLKHISDYLKDADITMANQETMIGGEEVGLSTYPAFNSPKAVGNALKNAGVDIVTLANNHALDRGEAAIQSAIRHWRKIDMIYTGAFRDQQDSETIRVMDTAADISVAFLSYTYGTNGIPVPEGKSYLVNIIDREKIISDIEEAKKQADAVIVSYHAGTEYEPLPNQQQKELAQLAADHGADAVIGHHPHVLQPAEWLEGENGEKTFVIYSLGNFLSGQDEFYNQIGGIVSFDLSKTANGEVDVVNPAFALTFVDFENEQNYRVLPMYDVNEEKVKEAYQEKKAHMKKWMPELTIVEDW